MRDLSRDLCSVSSMARQWVGKWVGWVVLSVG